MTTHLLNNIVLSEFDPWLNLADPPNVVLVCGSIPMASCKAVSILVHPVYMSCYTLLPFYLSIYPPNFLTADCSIPTY